MSKRPVQKHLFRVLTLSLVILLAGGGIALLYQWHLGSISSYASSDNVVGQPSLPAANVDAIFRQMGSPMVGTGKAVEAASRAQNIDDAFALAVWWTETNDGAAGVGLADRNPGSVRGSTGYPSAYDGYTIYPSYSAAVTYWFMMLKKVYIARGLTTVSAISHPYVGTSTSDLWAGKVITLMQRYRAEAPPPAPTATPVPTIAPDITRQGKQLAREQQQQGQSKSTYYPPASQNAQTQTASASQGLSGNMRTALVLFDLLLALALGLWAWSVNRRYAGRIQPALTASAANNPWEQTSTQNQPAAAAMQQVNNPWEWQQAAAMQQVSNPWELRPAAAMRQISNPWELQQAAAMQQANNPWEQMPVYGQQTTSFFNTFNGPQRTTEGLAPDMRTTETFAAAPSAQPNYTASASLFSLEAFIAGPPRFPGLQTPQPDATFVEQQDWPSNVSASGDKQNTFALEPDLLRFAQSSFHRTRLQSTAERPQPIGIGSGGGLLSRYREQQVQSRQE
jgi:hypothetical protein